MIRSILDTDLYKLSMQLAVLEKYPDTKVTYQFKNRGPQKFYTNFGIALKDALESMSRLALTADEYSYLKHKVPFLKPMYLEYLKNYRFDPRAVHWSITDDGEFNLWIENSYWHESILWEVPLMAIISRTYFHLYDTDWSYEGQVEKIHSKGKKLLDAGCTFTDFGTRRRRSFETQDMVVRELKAVANGDPRFVGTSNVFLAMKHDVKALGTMAHEWIMGISSLESLRHANRYAMRLWMDVYNASLGTALPDTFGTQAFWGDFDLKLSKSYDGVRHDSGCPIKFGEAAIAHYKSFNIDPLTKSIIFSDSLNADKVIELHNHFKGRIRTSFGIGTNFTNDFDSTRVYEKGIAVKSAPLNMVIKLRTVDGQEVVKLSDEPGKATGGRDAVRIAKSVFLNEPLDAK